MILSTERPAIKEIEVPAFLKEGKKVVFYVDLVNSGRVHVISEYISDNGVYHRMSGWLGEDDSLAWEENDEKSRSE